MAREPSYLTVEPGFFDDALPASPERDLWRAVVVAGIYDAKSKSPCTRAAVARWIDTDDFNRVCQYAALDPEVMQAAIQKVLKHGTIYLAESEAEREARLTKARKAKRFNDRRRDRAA